jgi:hypothetical protein
MKNITYFFVGLLFLLILSACKGRQNEIKKSSEISYETKSDNNIRKVFENIYYLFPSPSDFLLAINLESLEYNPGLLNSIEKREKYVKPSDQYLNLGVYIADLSYCSLFGRNNDAENYLETIKRMSDDVNLSTEINKDLFEKLKDKVNSGDSLAKIINDFFSKVIYDLEVNNRQYDLTIITTGAYIECLYLSANNVTEFKEDNPIIQRIVEQKFAFNNLYKYCQKYVSNEDLTKSLFYIQEVNDAFGKFSGVEEKLEVKKESNNHLVISGGSTVIVTESQFISFKEKITKIRNSIIK